MSDPRQDHRWYHTPLRWLRLAAIPLLVLCGWCGVEVESALRQKAVVEQIENLGGLVWYDYQFDAAGKEVPGALFPADPWLRWFFGDDFFTNVTRLHIRQFTDEGLEPLEGLSHLEWLNLAESRVTDAGLEHLKRLTQLHTLNLRTTKVTDAGLEKLKGLSKLHSLDVSGTAVTDAGLEQLKGLRNLKQLNLAGTQVTDAGVKDLQETLPNCRIYLR